MHCEAGEGYWVQGETALQAHSFRDADPQPVIPKKESDWNGLDIPTNDMICLEKSGHGNNCIWMTKHFFEWLESVQNGKKARAKVGNKSGTCCSSCSQLVPSNFIGHLRLFVLHYAVWLPVHILRKFRCCVTALPVGCVYFTHILQKPCSTTAMAVYAIYEATAKKLQFASGKSRLATFFFRL